MTEFGKLRCQHEVFRYGRNMVCGGVLGSAASTATGAMDLKCWRCHKFSVVYSSQASFDRGSVRAVH